MVQELRTPMTSITGYIDLLLGESAGILGEMQRKFLQRVSVNVGRLTGMLDDLVQITQLDTGQFELEPEHVDVVAMIEDAITSASTQFREKGLTVQLDLDDEVPAVPADRDAIGQIIGQLLTNAYLVSPPDSEIYISALRKPFALDRGEHDAEQIDSLYVAVEDRGGGIAPEDEARVFSRKYKAENPLIQGLGDTGVGLSIAKALAEAHGGKLWLETRDNLGSRFVFVLPIMAMSELEGESAEG
jgi:signal transduction histidine kinase